jgi:SM-20-related protein
MGIDILVLDRFLEPGECQRIIAEVTASASNEAGVYGGRKAVDPVVRKALVAAVSQDTLDTVSDSLAQALPVFSKHFGVHITSFEPPQFLHYRTGDYFVAHQDGNTPLIQDETLGRKVSVSIFLNPQTEPATVGTYSGGSLVLHGSYPDWEYRKDVTSPPGTLVAFRSETTHEVLPVSAGERFAIVAWFRSQTI